MNIIATKSLLLKENIESLKFNRFDIIVRMLTIDAIKNNDFKIIELYNKMQRIRVLENSKINPLRANNIARYKDLIKSIQIKGYDINYPVNLNKWGNLINGAHRVAVCLNNDIDFIPVQYSIEEKEINSICYYGIEWFTSREFSSEELSVIYNAYLKVRMSCLNQFFCIIWCPAISKLNSIILNLNKKLNIERIVIKEIDFNNSRKLGNFIRKVYAKDNMQPNRLNQKVLNIVNFNTHKIYFLKLEVFLEPKSYTDYIYKKKDNLEDIKKVKLDVRKYIECSIENYVFDNAFHCGSSYFENEYLKILFENEKGKIYEIKNNFDYRS